MANTDLKPRKRKRGIKASRVKLEEAMAKAKFKTQASLAEAIADKENLDSAPKDIVSKVFREIPVEPSSIQRIATVLGVESYTLYKSTKEEKRENTSAVQELESGPTEEALKSNSPLEIRTIILFILLGLVGITATIVTGSYLNTNGDHKVIEDRQGTFAYKKPILGMFSLVVDSDEKSRELLPFSTLLKNLKNNYTLSDYAQFSTTVNADSRPYDILKELQSDFFLQLETTEYGNFVSITASIYADETSHNVWSVSVRRSFLEQDVAIFINDLVSTIEFETGITSTYSSMFNESANKLAMREYMQGRALLDQSQDNSNFKKARNYFLNATNLSPEFASAHASICETLVSESWNGNEKLLLEEAQNACDKATTFLPLHPHIFAANFLLLRRTGRVGEALKLHGSIDLPMSKGVDYMNALSATKLEAYRQNPENNQYLAEAKKLVDTAIAIDPSFWQSYNTLGLIQFSLGNTQAAIDALAVAVEYNPNELLYVNLGTLNFCQMNEEKALHYYSESLNLASDHHLTNEMIGLVHYFNKNYQASYEYRKKALDSLENYGVHNLYGSIAESAEKLNMKKEAILYFRKAKKNIERDTLRGNLTPTEEAIGLYYDIKLRQLNGDKIHFDSDHLKRRINELSDIAANLESTAIIRLALVHSFFENFERAQKLLRMASERCPVYLNLPDLEFLFENEDAI